MSSAGEVREAALLLALAVAAAEEVEDKEGGLADFVEIGILS